MKFFIPHADDDVQAERVHNAARQFCEDQTGWRILPERIYSIRYRHDGHEYFAQVGHEDPRQHEKVLCIFKSEITYFVCTQNRGVVRGEPILLGEGEVSDIEYFDGYERQPR